MYTTEQISHWFTRPKDMPAEVGRRLTEIHNEARELALKMASIMPPGEEAKMALDRLQESVLWANTALSRH